MSQVTKITSKSRPTTYSFLCPKRFSEIAADAKAAATITVTERHELMAAMMDDTLSTEEKIMVDRLIYAYRRGRLNLKR